MLFRSRTQKIQQSLYVYLSGGNSYSLDINYESFINEQFKRFFNKNRDEIKDLYKRRGLNRILNNEKDYNNSYGFGSSPIDNIYLADQVYLRNVEICDLIVFDGSRTYLICNKSEPNGIGSRDLVNQILSSSHLLINDFSAFEEYYKDLCAKKELIQIN